MVKQTVKTKKRNKLASKKSKISSNQKKSHISFIIFGLVILSKIGYFVELPFKKIPPFFYKICINTIAIIRKKIPKVRKQAAKKVKKVFTFTFKFLSAFKLFFKTLINNFFSAIAKLFLTFIVIEKFLKSFKRQIEKNKISFIKFVKKNLRKRIDTNLLKSKKKKRRKSRFYSKPFWISPKFAIFVVFLSGLLIFSVIKVNAYLGKIPDPKNINDFPLPAATLIYDRNGTLLYSAYADTFRVPVALNYVPKILQDATIASEDQRFYKHRGFDLISTARSVINNLQGKSLQGGSTITQQVAKNSFLSNKKTISRKIEEAIISKRLEKRFTKKQILELYFNTVSYGGNTVGIKTAALHYFGKEPSDLTSKEAIFLASITPAPSVYSAEVENRLVHPQRIDYVLDRMEEEKMINHEQRKKIEEEKLVFSPQLAYKRAPHAVDYVLLELEKKYGRDQVLKHGMVVKTTLDLPLQNYIQKTVLENVAAARWNNLTNTGVVVVSPRDGAILAMVGSSNYYDLGGGQFNTVTAERQLGSTLKVITYARAFEDGLTPFSTIVDAPITFPGYSDYKPKNYDSKFHGKITLKSAFANSYNIPALKLAYNLGLDRIADLGYRMGIDEFDFGDKPKPLSMAIGGVEVSLIHLVQAYSVVANNGYKVKLDPVSEIYDHNGKLIYRKEVNGEQVLSQSTATAIFSVLSDNAARLPAFGRSYHLEFGTNKVAVKTGTSNDVKDNVAIAFDKNFVVGVWAGNNDSSPMHGVVSGYSAPTLTMHEVVEKMLADYSEGGSNLSANLKNQSKN